MPTVSDNAQADVDALIARPAEVRIRHYAHALNESIPGVGSVSFAVSDSTTRERLAFCLSFPSADADAGSIQALALDLMTEAAAIGRLPRPKPRRRKKTSPAAASARPCAWVASRTSCSRPACRCSEACKPTCRPAC